MGISWEVRPASHPADRVPSHRARRFPSVPSHPLFGLVDGSGDGCDAPRPEVAAVLVLYFAMASSCVLADAAARQIWLLGAALAHPDVDKPFLAGIWIGYASLTKLFAVLLMPFILQHKWKAVAGFASVWIVALPAVIALRPSAILRYLEVNRTNGMDMTRGQTMAGSLGSLWNWLGPIGIVMGMAFLLWVGVEGEGSHNWHTFGFLGRGAPARHLDIFSSATLAGDMGAAQAEACSRQALFLTFITPPFSYLFALFSLVIVVLYGMGPST